MTTITDWITAIASSVTGVGILLLAYQVYLAKKSLEADHERSRRERLIQVIAEWEKEILPTMSAADKLVSNFSDDQCRDTVEFKPFTINSKYKDLIKACLGTDSNYANLETTNDNIELEEKEISIIRFLIAKYLT